MSNSTLTVPLHLECETCGQATPEMWHCQDTMFCAACWADFGTDRWKGIGSKKAAPAPGKAEKR